LRISLVTKLLFYKLNADIFQQHLIHPGNAPTPAAISSPMPAPRRSKSKMSQNQQQQLLLQQQQQQEEAVVHNQLAAAAQEASSNPINIDVYAALGSELTSGKLNFKVYFIL